MAVAALLGRIGCRNRTQLHRPLVHAGAPDLIDNLAVAVALVGADLNVHALAWLNGAAAFAHRRTRPPAARFLHAPRASEIDHPTGTVGLLGDELCFPRFGQILRTAAAAGCGAAGGGAARRRVGPHSAFTALDVVAVVLVVGHCPPALEARTAEAPAVALRSAAEAHVGVVAQRRQLAVGAVA